MNFLNLSPLEVGTIFTAITTGITLLYLLDRSRRKLVVATLRFWQPADEKQQVERRRRINQPWSLILQLLALLLLLLAIAQPQFGLFGAPANHVFILDTSAIMAASTGPQQTLLDRAKQDLIACVRRMPNGDRGMLVTAAGVPTAIVPFTADIHRLEEGILKVRPTSTALRLQPALELAAAARDGLNLKAGDTVYAGCGRAADTDEARLPTTMRWLQTPCLFDNAGLRNVVLTRADDATWRLTVTIANDAPSLRAATLYVSLGKAIIAQRRLTLKPQSEQQDTLTLALKEAGELRLWLDPKDALMSDNEATLELPERRIRRVAILTDRPDTFRSLTSANPAVQATIKPIAQYSPDSDADVFVIDGFTPLPEPRKPALIMNDGNGGRFQNLRVASWRADHPVTRGLQSLRLKLPTAALVSTDYLLGNSAEGPIAGIKTGKTPQIVLGFRLSDDALRMEVATPLLFANAIDWLTPEFLDTGELRLAPAGAVSLPAPTLGPQDTVVLLDAQGAPLPYTLRDHQLQFFSGDPGLVRLRAGKLETAISLSLPELKTAPLDVPPTVKRTLPNAVAGLLTPREWWPWLATLGALLLVADWIIFGSGRPRILHWMSRAPAFPAFWRRAS